VGSVWEAMRKHQAEQAAAAQASPKPADAGQAVKPAPAVSPAVPTSTPETARPTNMQLPAPSNNGYAEDLVAYHDRGGRITEQYRSLRTHLLAQHADERFCVLITSAEAGEGKTVTCVNLAVTLAERRERSTVIVDGDLRRGWIAKMLAGQASPGLADVLRGERGIRDVLQATKYPNLFFVPAGQARHDEAADLVGRPEMGEAISLLRRQFDYVLLDSPPVNALSDACIMGGVVGEALVVMRMNRTPRDATDRAIRLLKAGNAKVVGMVLTHQKFDIPNYLYRYG
jgi:capsular exopolysaccharide synthesis family protein